MSTKLPAGTLESFWADSNNWRAGLIYVCKDDPRLVVPKRLWKWGGWTVNFAHASAWLLLLAVILTATIPAVFLSLAQMLDPWLWLAYIIGFTVFACVLSAILSSPKRYERAG